MCAHIIKVISLFNLGFPHLTLKEGANVKSDYIKRSMTSYWLSSFDLEGEAKSDHIRSFPAHDFLLVGLTSQTSRTNNKGDIGTFKVCYMGHFGIPWMTLNEEPQSQMFARL